MNQYGIRLESFLHKFEGRIMLFSPLSMLVLEQKIVERSQLGGKVWKEFRIVIDEAEE